MQMSQIIETKLRQAFDPIHLEVIDESEAHRGHAGFREGGETHFRVHIRAASFDGQSRVAAQRAIYAVLKDEMAERIHALALKVEAA